ncbi:hypothetical protein RYH80_09115 [Halobaculum sp. MBLA0147]|uniref:hypothetical protein n=1 Tax=Halobaculum sp. MBLA0147 TaxID=3079934 RepID=UPI0035262239
MRRRALLAAVAAGLAGCGGRTAPGDLPTTPTDDTQTPTETPATDATPATQAATDGGRGDPETWVGDTRAVAFETGPRTVALAAPGVRLDSLRLRAGFARTATAEGPAVLRATLGNPNDWTETLRLTEIPLFEPVQSVRRSAEAGGPATLYLAPTAAHDLADAATPAERDPRGYWRATETPDPLPETTELGPGETLYGEYHLLGHADRTGFATGAYQFDHDSGLTLHVWNTETPGPTAESRFAGISPPPLPGSDGSGGSDGTTWYHNADGDTSTFLRPSAEQVATPGAVSFEVVNHTTERLPGNYHDWSVHKLVDGRWHLLDPWVIPMPLTPLGPGETHRYDLRVFHGAYDDATADGRHGSDELVVPYLGGGRYAFDATFGDGVAALFDVDAPPLSVSPPSEAVSSTDGDRVEIRDGDWRDADGTVPASNYRVTVRAERLTGATETGGDGTPTGDGTPDGDDADDTGVGVAGNGRLVVIAEQLYRERYRALRGVLSGFGDGVSTVLFRTADGGLGDAVPAFDESPRRVVFDGDAYAVSTSRE